MEKIFYIIAGIINWLHDLIIVKFKAYGLQLSDKDMHFWIIGGAGICIFLAVDWVFKQLAKWSISAISFVYTFTLLVVIVFGLEIQQGITGGGNVEFADIVAGLWGFVAMFVVYATIKGLAMLLGRGFNRSRKRR